MKTLTFFSLLFVSFCAKAQKIQNDVTDGQYFQDGTGKIIRQDKGINDYIEGSPYLNDNWTEGIVVLNNGKAFKYRELRYNLFSGELEFHKDDEILAVTLPYTEFRISEMIFKNGFPPTEKQTNKSFYQVLYAGKLSLLCYRTARIVGETPFVTVSTGPRKYLPADTYYILKPNSGLIKVKNDKKSIFSALGGNESKLEEYCEKEGLKLKKWTEVVKLLSFYETFM